MESTSLRPNIQTLQQDVINLLSDISRIFEDAIPVLGDGELAQKSKQTKLEIDRARENVEKLELHMAIVAPMKAGKSTVINAIAGQELLPSRNAAMTTLPTEIVLDAKLHAPQLLIDPTIVDLFQQALQGLVEYLDKKGIEPAKQKLAQYPHLHPLLDRIKTFNIQIQDRIDGREAIIQILADLNDIIRLCSFLMNTDLLSRLESIPRVVTPYWLQLKLEDNNLLGNLVIIDTPGPNEAGDNLRLSGVVERELRKSSIILIVLDFTQLKTEAAEKVKEDVKRVIELRGQDSLYILINKADQRRDGDMSPREVQNFVASEFGLHSHNLDKVVFEISARRAFSANSFFKFVKDQEMESLDEARHLKPVRLLAEEVLGIDWEEELEEMDLDDLIRKAQRLWKKSQFESFISNAIRALMENAAPRTINSALHLSRNRLTELKSETVLRNSAILKDAEKLRQEVIRLKDDLNHLDHCKSRLQQVRDIKEPLRKYLEETLRTIQKDIDSTIRQRFIDKDYDRGSVIQKLDMIAREFFSTKIFDFETPLSKLANVLSYKTKGVVKFDSKNEADKFSQECVNYCRSLIEEYFSTFRQLFEKKVKGSYCSLCTTLEKGTKPILERATARLSREFDVQLEPFSPPDLNTEACGKINFQAASRSRKVTRIETRKRRRWFTLWLWKVDTDVEVQATEDYYLVILNDLVARVNQSLEEQIRTTYDNVCKYIDEDVQGQIDAYFESLDRYLSGYRESLKNAQLDQTLSFEEKKELKKKLQSIITNSGATISQCARYSEQIRQILPPSDLLG